MLQTHTSAGAAVRELGRTNMSALQSIHHFPAAYERWAYLEAVPLPLSNDYMKRRHNSRSCTSRPLNFDRKDFISGVNADTYSWGGSFDSCQTSCSASFHCKNTKALEVGFDEPVNNRCFQALDIYSRLTSIPRVTDETVQLRFSLTQSLNSQRLLDEKTSAVWMQIHFMEMTSIQRLFFKMLKIIWCFTLNISVLK